MIGFAIWAVCLLLILVLGYHRRKLTAGTLILTFIGAIAFWSSVIYYAMNWWWK